MTDVDLTAELARIAERAEQAAPAWLRGGDSTAWRTQRKMSPVSSLP